jgi:hypothetical protein
MNVSRILSVLGAPAVVASAIAGSAHAQVSPFGQLSLPETDFTWIWGNLERARGREDLSIRSADSGFQCTLKAGYAPGSRLTMEQERELENQLTTALYFIQESAYTMNALEQRRDIDWATLNCVRPEPNVDEAEQQERLEKLRERALRRSERRLERRDDE